MSYINVSCVNVPCSNPPASDEPLCGWYASPKEASRPYEVYAVREDDGTVTIYPCDTGRPSGESYYLGLVPANVKWDAFVDKVESLADRLPEVFESEDTWPPQDIEDSLQFGWSDQDQWSFVDPSDWLDLSDVARDILEKGVESVYGDELRRAEEQGVIMDKYDLDEYLERVAEMFREAVKGRGLYL